MRGYVVGKPDIASDYTVVPYSDATEYGRVGVNSDVVLENRVSGLVHEPALLVVAEVLCSERNSLIESDVIADNRGGSDYHAGAVVDGEVSAYAGGRMDIDSGL